MIGFESPASGFEPSLKFGENGGMQPKRFGPISAERRGQLARTYDLAKRRWNR
jgi:hypothetical protein